ncbi:MAG TPA: DUF302 domain-containing protein [Thermoanaerobaculia bacterium]|nr:DUF302 domain-containing protein [Thermoanaerobaculia bacterium]
MSKQSSWKRGIVVLALTLTTLGLTGAAVAAPAGPGVQVQVKGTVSQALASLKKTVADNGMMVMGELHQGKVLAMTGLHTQSESVFVGNPTVGKKLFSAEPGAGLAVPVRINIYADANGNTVLSYIPPSQALSAFGNSKVTGIAKMLDKKLAMMARMLAK